MNNQVIINEIYRIMNNYGYLDSKSEFPSHHSFKYTGNIKTQADSYKLKLNPQVSIFGQKNIDEYYRQYKMLYDNLNIANKKISFKYFVTSTEQIVFTKNFNEKNIKDCVNNMEKRTIKMMTRIFGVKLDKNTLELGDFTFIKKEYILNFFEQLKLKENQEKDLIFESKQMEIEGNTNFIYVLHEYEAVDTFYCKDRFDEDIQKLINVLRYMTGIRQERYYISSYELRSYRRNVTYIYDNGSLGGGMNTTLKDRAITLDEEFYNSDEIGNKYIWNLLKKKKRNDYEDRILRSIDWIGVSIFEELDDIAITEVAFAFECLLKYDKKTVISPSIQGQIAEFVAFISGEDIEERIGYVKDFKSLYSIRSAVAHGGIKKENSDYYKYLYMFKRTLINLITKKEFQNVKSLEGLKRIINEFKYK